MKFLVKRILLIVLFGKNDMVEVQKKNIWLLFMNMFYFNAKNKESLKNIFVPLDEETIKRYYKLKDSNFKTRGHYRTHPLEGSKKV